MSNNLDCYAQEFEEWKKMPQDRREFIDFAERQEARKISKETHETLIHPITGLVVRMGKAEKDIKHIKTLPRIILYWVGGISGAVFVIYEILSIIRKSPLPT